MRGVLLCLNALGVIAGRAGGRERAERVLDEPRRLAQARVDGPGLAGCYMAMADVAHADGDPAESRRCLKEALDRFYEPTKLPNGSSWLHLMCAHDALALGDGGPRATTLRGRAPRSRSPATSSGRPVATRWSCAADGANGALTAR